MNPPLDAIDRFAALLDEVRLPEPAQRGHATEDQVRAVEAWVRDALASDDFLLDCLARDLARPEPASPTAELAPFYKHPQSRVQVALAYWSPGSAAGPHEHNDWTVTAVVHNRLEVTTFDLAAARRERRLVQRHVFPALPGRVGHIFDHGLHDPRNPTRQWSISLHVFGPQRRPGLESEVGPIEGLTRSGDGPAVTPDLEPAVARVLQGAWLQGVHRARVAALSALASSARAVPLLEAIGARGDETTQHRAASALLGHDEARGRRALGALAHHQLGMRSELAHAWPAEAALGVRLRDGQAEITVGHAPPRALLRVSPVAESALRFIAEHERFALAEVPGGFGLEDLRDLTGKLLLWGALRVVRPGPGANDANGEREGNDARTP